MPVMMPRLTLDCSSFFLQSWKTAAIETKEQATTQAADSMASCVTSTLAAEGKTVAALVCPSEDESLVYAGCDTQAFRERHHVTLSPRGPLLKPLSRESSMCISARSKTCDVLLEYGAELCGHRPLICRPASTSAF